MTSKINFTRKELNLVARNKGTKKPQNMSTEELLDTLSRYDIKRKVNSNRRKILKMGLKRVAKMQNISKNDLSMVKKLQNKSIDELREIARLRGNKTNDKSIKEGIIISLLKSEIYPVERNYMKYFNNRTNDYTYDDEIKSKINDIRLIFSRLGNIVTKNDLKKIKKEFYEKKAKRFR